MSAATASLITTRSLASFLIAILLLPALSELAAARVHAPTLRLLVAIAADCALAFCLLSAHSTVLPAGNRAELLALTSLGLLLIYVCSVAFASRSIRRQLTAFETAQTTAAFTLAASSVLHFGSRAGLAGFGILCLVLATAAYTAAFESCAFATRANYRIFVSWSLPLGLLGCFLAVNPGWQAAILGTAAITVSYFGVGESRLTLAFHGLVYLVCAAFTCGLLRLAVHAFAGKLPSAPTNTALMIVIVAVLCYAVGGQIEQERWPQILFQTLSAVLAVCVTAAALVSPLAWLMGTFCDSETAAIVLARTIALSSLAVGLAYLGPRWRRIELIWLAYASLVLLGGKLVFEDLPFGQPESVASSAFFYAVVVFSVPRLARRSPTPLHTIPLEPSQATRVGSCSQ